MLFNCHPDRIHRDSNVPPALHFATYNVKNIFDTVITNSSLIMQPSAPGGSAEDGFSVFRAFCGSLISTSFLLAGFLQIVYRTDVYSLSKIFVSVAIVTGWAARHPLSGYSASSKY
ncbi:hypothetical protein A8C56_09120 [Niabella ginsenosidivorans]|uniref:Uncharacterized protein n=1 Tax=Niabella ginsenosidivorans TaxID=1176587 RepID=A0A1A9I0E8_9BACT|nr:hypothetical protein A8C56_09120 [Niabella ginsenosidivorans]